MTTKQKEEIKKLMADGYGYRKIAHIIGVSENTVKSYFRRKSPENNTEHSENECLCCGRKFSEIRKGKKFCSDKCRKKWWQTNSDSSGKIKCICGYCGKFFYTYASKERKYCSRECYANSKRRIVKNG